MQDPELKLLVGGPFLSLITAFDSEEAMVQFSLVVLNSGSFDTGNLCLAVSEISVVHQRCPRGEVPHLPLTL